jgi:DNA invertase Pin-like site-specific DNA recombinase
MDDSGIRAYGRLSQEDSDRHTSTLEERIALRSGYLQQVAKLYHIALSAESIVFDVLSGASISERPQLLALLEDCRAGRLHTLIIFDIDRFTRDMGDWVTIKKALYKGRIRLLTARGEYHFTPQFDSTLLDILAVFGEGERRKFSFRAKAANDQRARKGQLSGGRAPYGYEWDKTERVYRVVASEYPIVEEIFRRLWTEGSYKIVRDFNSRAVAPPVTTQERRSAVGMWTPSTLRGIAGNPFYAGYPAKRGERDREGKTTNLPRSEWIWAEVEQSYPHPISLDEWEALQERVTSRQNNQGPQKALLTGLLKCSQGRPMHRSAHRYACACHIYDESHAGQLLLSSVIDEAVLCAIETAWDAIPPRRIAAAKIETPKPQDNAAAELLRIMRQIREKSVALSKLQQDAGFLDNLRTYGREKRLADMSALDVEIVALEETAARLRADVQHQPIPSSLLDAIGKAGGFRALFETMTLTEQQASLKEIVLALRLDPVPAGKRNSTTLQVTLRPPLGDGKPIRAPLLYPKYKPRELPLKKRRNNSVD